MIRDIRRKTQATPSLAFETALARAVQIRSQQQASARLEALFVPCPGGRVHRQGQGPHTLGVRVKVSIVATNARAPGGQFVLHAAGRCRAIPMTATHCGPSSTKHSASPAARSSAPMSTRGTAATKPNPRRVFISGQKWRQLHQTRTATPRRHRARDRPHEGRGQLRPLLPQGPCRRRGKRRPRRRRIQLQAYPRRLRILLRLILWHT